MSTRARLFAAAAVVTLFAACATLPAEDEPISATSSAATCVDNGSGVGVGNGSDGALTVNAGTTTIDTVATTAQGTIATTSVTLGNAAGFGAGTIILLHQSQGAGAGTWEMARIVSLAGNVATVGLPLAATYTTAGPAHAQAILVPQFTTVTVAAAATLTAPAWNGTTGGILVMLANGAVTINGVVDMLGRGYRGGPGDGGNNSGGTCKGGFQGESPTGVGVSAITANGSGGGAGGANVNCCGGCPGNKATATPAGGGGGYGTAGANGVDGLPAGIGAGGATTGVANLTSLFFGSGGGSGGGNCAASSQPAGNGGGAIVVSATSIVLATGAARLRADGAKGGEIPNNWEGGSGGGAGGAIALSTQTATVPNGTITSLGGAGGFTCTTGGAGGNGRIQMAVGSYAQGSPASASPAANGVGFCSFAACLSNADCSGGKPVCDPVSRACVGCLQDNQCLNTQWCNISQTTCTGKLTNGTTIPTDPPHANPTLNGTCTSQAATTTCIAGVCDTKDNRCGYLNGSGPCTSQNAATVCRSGACSANGGVCIPTGGCAVDTDCNTQTQWCNVSTFTCTNKVPNGLAVPNDPQHGTPTIDGKCTGPAANVTCVSGVCDTSDDKCGYADGTGPCTSQNGATVCRSGLCGSGGVCISQGTCTVDADCPNGWCNISAKICANKIPNGTQVPSDPPHANPTLDGKCSGPAATLTCVSGVCDPKDDKCGLLSGTGPCTPQNGPIVCRSGLCSAGGVCIDPGTCASDADCPDAWCNIAAQKCTPKVPNGNAVPTDPGHTTPKIDGKCNPEAGKLVCVAAVCDPKDDKCGLSDGTPCDPKANQCRSGQCQSGLCGGSDGGIVIEIKGPAVVLEGGGCGCNSTSNVGGNGLTILGAIAVLGAMRRRRSAPD